MSHFSETLNTLIETEGINQTILAESSGVDRPTINRYCKGELAPTRKMLAQIVAAISKDQGSRVELLLAHLHDEAAAGSELAGFDARHYVIKPVSQLPDNAVQVPFGLISDFQILAEEASLHPDVRALLSGTAEMLLRHRAELADNSQLSIAEPPQGLDVVDRAIQQKKAALEKIDGYPTRRVSRKKR
jgi:predicted transcriptional regulator